MSCLAQGPLLNIFYAFSSNKGVLFHCTFSVSALLIFRLRKEELYMVLQIICRMKCFQDCNSENNNSSILIKAIIFIVRSEFSSSFFFMRLKTIMQVMFLLDISILKKWCCQGNMTFLKTWNSFISGMSILMPLIL